jgi:myo-inositol 2-dehydrogenase/D-chiro-inositol 1-dehydrogenase
MRIGVAGLGGMGTVHALNAAALEDAQLVAVASTRPEQARRVADDLGVRAATYDELVGSDDVDAIVVAARSIDHARVGREVLRAGKHLFLEKPGATQLADHDLLLADASAHPDAVVQVGYHRRFDPDFVALQRLVGEGAVGAPLLVVATSRDLRAAEPEDPWPAGGFLVDMASHDYDTACWLLGQEPTEVHVARQTLVYPELEPLGDLDNAVVTVAFDGGGLATTHVSRTCVFGHDIRTEVVGSEGSAFVGNAASHAGVTVVTGRDASRFPSDYRERFADAYRAELAAFVAACRGDGPRGPGLADDRRAVATGVAARSSAVDGVPRAVGVDWPWTCSNVVGRG